jgi:Protein of unknown function (DUF3606)
MADDKSNRGAHDRSRVNVHEDYELRYWTHKWCVTEAELKAAVDKVGVYVNAVAAELGNYWLRVSTQVGPSSKLLTLRGFGAAA